MSKALEIRTAVETWRLDHRGECPRASDLVTDRVVASASDPWGFALEVICGEGTTSIVRSVGADGKPGTDDDVYSDGLDPGEVAKAMVRALGHQAVEGKRQHTCPTTIDPWGTTTSGTCDVAGATIVSAGPDRELGTDDDVTARVDAAD